MQRKLNNFLKRIGVFERFDSTTEQSFLDYKFKDSKGVVISVGIATVFLIAGLWIWDWALDPKHAPNVLPVRLIMCMILSFYPLVVFAGFRRSTLPWLLAIIVVSTEAVFLYLLTQLKDGVIYGGFSGFMFWFILSVFAGLSFTVTESLLLNIVIASMPNLLVYLGLGSQLNLALYNALIWPTCFIAVFGNLSLDMLYRRLFKYRQRIETLAKIDGLTGITNRSHFIETAPVLLDLCRRHEHPISVFMIDIDHFKQINDLYGHPEGDEVIRLVAEKLQTMLRNTDLLARYGGEEFAVILPETVPQNALTVAESIRRNIEETPVILGANRSIRITVSVGVAGYVSLPDEIGLEELLKQADLHLYEAKQRGRNRVVAAKKQGLIQGISTCPCN
ncbi:MAG: diguanylate cyclase [Desulfuromonadales bacterium]|nr:diguanylate cyclase [Desulfuromonadales bacterium]